jgi:hypothetical protein
MTQYCPVGVSEERTASIFICKRELRQATSQTAWCCLGVLAFTYFSILKMETGCFFETEVHLYRTTRYVTFNPSIFCHIILEDPNKTCTVIVLRADSPGKAAQWFAESIPEIEGCCG